MSYMTHEGKKRGGIIEKISTVKCQGRNIIEQTKCSWQDPQNSMHLEPTCSLDFLRIQFLIVHTILFTELNGSTRLIPQCSQVWNLEDFLIYLLVASFSIFLLFQASNSSITRVTRIKASTDILMRFSSGWPWCYDAVDFGIKRSKKSGHIKVLPQYKLCTQLLISLTELKPLCLSLNLECSFSTDSHMVLLFSYSNVLSLSRESK